MPRFSPVVACALLAAASCASPVRTADATAVALPGASIGGGLPRGFESSGAAWHPRLGRLLVVDDGGRLALLDRDGGSVELLRVPGDLEGVCVADPTGDMVYVGSENPPRIVEVDLRRGAVTRSFVLFDRFPKGPGLEALTFVPDADSPEGGRFYVGLQADGSVRVFELPIRSSRTRTDVKAVSWFTPVPGRSDLSGLHYDVARGVLYAIYDRDDRMLAMTTDGTVLDGWPLPGDAQEGIAIDGCDLFVADDGGPVLRYRFVAEGAAGAGTSCGDNERSGVPAPPDETTSDRNRRP